MIMVKPRQASVVVDLRIVFEEVIIVCLSFHLVSLVVWNRSVSSRDGVVHSSSDPRPLEIIGILVRRRGNPSVASSSVECSIAGYLRQSSVV